VKLVEGPVEDAEGALIDVDVEAATDDRFRICGRLLSTNRAGSSALNGNKS
jgi:hypothetical protein